MSINTILESIDAEISRLEQAKALLSTLSGHATTTHRRGRKKAVKAAKADPAKVTSFALGGNVASKKKRTLSAAARKSIADAQKKRWAKARAAKKSASKATK